MKNRVTGNRGNRSCISGGPPVCVWAQTIDTRRLIPNYLRLKFKFQSQINIWDVDIKAYFLVEIMVELNGIHGQGTHCTKIGADSLAKNTTNAPKFIGPIGLPKPKSPNKKRLHRASLVRVYGGWSARSQTH